MDKKGWFIEKFYSLPRPPYHTNGNGRIRRHPIRSAASIIWDLIDKGLSRLGLDAWWMDTTEPETEGWKRIFSLHKNCGGKRRRFVNIFPLMYNWRVYQASGARADQKPRCFIPCRGRRSPGRNGTA